MQLDSQRRLIIPNTLLTATDTPKQSALHLAIREDHIILFVLSQETENIEYHDIVTLDSKGRVVITKRILQYLGLKEFSTSFIVSALRNQIIIRWKNEGI